MGRGIAEVSFRVSCLGINIHIDNISPLNRRHTADEGSVPLRSCRVVLPYREVSSESNPTSRVSLLWLVPRSQASCNTIWVDGAPLRRLFHDIY